MSHIKWGIKQVGFTVFVMLVFFNITVSGQIQKMTSSDVFLFSQKIKTDHFMHIFSYGDNLHEMSNSVFWKNQKIIQISYDSHLLWLLLALFSLWGIRQS